MDLRVIDKGSDAMWLVHVGAYRIVDPTSNHAFEPGIKYHIKPTSWTQSQPTIKVTDDVDEEVLKEVLTPVVPGQAMHRMDDEIAKIAESDKAAEAAQAAPAAKKPPKPAQA